MPVSPTLVCTIVSTNGWRGVCNADYSPPERQALRWVQKYISAFGGDPEKVTMRVPVLLFVERRANRGQKKLGTISRCDVSRPSYVCERRGHRRSLPWCVHELRRGDPQRRYQPRPTGLRRAGTNGRVCWSRGHPGVPTTGTFLSIEGGSKHVTGVPLLPGLLQFFQPVEQNH